MPNFKKFILKNFVSSLFLLFILSGSAQAQFFIQGGKEVLSVSGGDHINKSIIIHNTTKETLDLRAYWEDFKYLPPFDGTKSFSPAGTGERSMSKWFSFSPVEFKVPPFGQQKINYTVTVPGNIDGGYYGVLFVQKAADSAIIETGMQIITRVGSLFFVEPKDIVRKAEFTDIATVEKTLTGNLHNQSKLVLIPDMTFYFMDDQGVVADRGEIKKLYLAPDGSGKFVIPFPSGLTGNKYTLVVNADLGDSNAVVKEIELTKDASDNFTISSSRD